MLQKNIEANALENLEEMFPRCIIICLAYTQIFNQPRNNVLPAVS